MAYGIITSVLKVGNTIVPTTHQVVHLILEDGRQLWVSPGHPTIDGSRVGNLRVGDVLDGSRVLASRASGIHRSRHL